MQPVKLDVERLVVTARSTMNVADGLRAVVPYLLDESDVDEYSAFEEFSEATKLPPDLLTLLDPGNWYGDGWDDKPLHPPLHEFLGHFGISLSPVFRIEADSFGPMSTGTDWSITEDLGGFDIAFSFGDGEWGYPILHVQPAGSPRGPMRDALLADICQHIAFGFPNRLTNYDEDLLPYDAIVMTVVDLVDKAGYWDMLRDSIIDDVLHPEVLRSPRSIALQLKECLEATASQSGQDPAIPPDEKLRLLLTYMQRSYRGGT